MEASFATCLPLIDAGVPGVADRANGDAVKAGVVDVGVGDPPSS